MVVRQPEAVQVLQSWREEIAAELDQEKAAIAPLETEHATALAAAGAAESAHRDLQTMLEAAFKRLASPLAERLTWLRSQVDDARRRVARAHGALEAARDRIAVLRSALNQIDHMITVDEAEEEAA